MFVGTTFHSCIDRLSIHSVLSGKTGSLLGLICSAILIIVCFLVFIGPVINYFRGDYVQASFTALKTENLELYTGRDFKFAVSFFEKDTRVPVDFRNILNLFDV